MKKTIFLIPGYRQHPDQKAYIKLKNLLKNLGFDTIPVKIKWNKTTISQNTKKFIQKYKSVDRKKKYIIGFSFGAMIALLASTKVKTSGLILCSLSPYFKEDLPRPSRKHLLEISEKLYNDFSILEYKKITQQIKTRQITLLYGSKESTVLIRRNKEAYKNIIIPKKKIVALKNVGHEIGNREYLKQITKLIQNFS